MDMLSAAADAASAEEKPPQDCGLTPRKALAGVAWLGGVAPATLDRLAAHAVIHRVPAGSILFEQAEIPASAQFLLGGSVGLLGVRGRAETLIETLRPVDLVLPAAVLNRQPCLLRARVTEAARLLLVQADAFRAAVVGDHALCMAMLACLGAQFRRQVRQAKNVRLRSAEERVGCYLLSLPGTEGGDPVRLPMEKNQIASQLGMTRETFSRCLARMSRFGLRVSGERLTVQDAAAARAHFAPGPFIDGPEPVVPLQVRS